MPVLILALLVPFIMTHLLHAVCIYIVTGGGPTSVNICLKTFSIDRLPYRNGSVTEPLIMEMKNSADL